MPMSKVNSRRILQTSTHVLGWGVLFFVVIFVFPYANYNRPPSESWIYKTLIHLSLLVVFFYVNALVLIPRFLFPQRSYLYFGLVVVGLVGFYWLTEWLNDALGINKLAEAEFKEFLKSRGEVFKPRNRNRPRPWLFEFFPIISALITWGISTSLTFISKWYKDVEIQQQLEKERISAELSYLKTQINPHFFFNTLNNIYALIAIDQTRAQMSVHKLSRLMRYVLYDTQPGTTLLSQEIAFLKDYLELVQLRLKKDVKVVFEYPDDIQDLAIAPMLMLPFVENAFKHGVDYTQPSFVEIKLAQQGTQLTFSTRNRIIVQKSAPLDESNGIGLVNTRRRLDLLYPDQYKLYIAEDKDLNEYYVELTLTVR
jgi:two-component system, LytTR family, sensor kinase